MTVTAHPTVVPRPLERAADRAAGSPAIPGNKVDLLIDGPDTYAVMRAMIASATRRIHLENYIIHDDDTGWGFAEALANKAHQGVIVRVLYDWFGSWGTSRRYWNTLRAAGVEVVAFGPPLLRDPLLLATRDHRKLLTVDGEHAVTGGLCIGDEWIGNPESGQLPWRDTAVAIRGPGVRALDVGFARAWIFAGGTPPDDANEVPGEVATAGETATRGVSTEPGLERAWRTMELLFGIGAERIWVTEAYLAAPQRLYQAFKDAARAGVDVRLLVPGASDIPLVRNISRTEYRGLLRSGVRIWEWGGPMLHAKSMVVDGRWTRVGSSNLNPSSLLANWEIDVFVDDDDLARRMEAQFLRDLARSSEVVLRSRSIKGFPRARIPGAFERQVPETASEGKHSPTSRELRRQALLQVSLLVRGARAAIFGPLALMLFVAAFLLVLFPLEAAYLSAALLGLSGAALVVRALGHRARG